MISFNQSQNAAALMLRSQIAQGGDIRFTSPSGSGKSMIVAVAISYKTYKILHLSKFRELNEQFKSICAKVECSASIEYEHRVTRKIRGDLSQYGLIILTEDLRDLQINHPNVLRIC